MPTLPQLTETRVEPVTSILRAILHDTLRKPFVTRDLVWTEPMVVRLWQGLYAGHSLGRITTRLEPKGKQLGPIARPTMVPRTSLVHLTTDIDGTPAVYDGYQRCAALAMSALGLSVDVRWTDAPVSYRVAFNPLTEVFYRAADRRIRKDPAMFRDVSALFIEPENVEEIIARFVFDLRADYAKGGATLSAYDATVAYSKLMGLSTLFDHREAELCEMGVETTSRQALEAYFLANRAAA